MTNEELELTKELERLSQNLQPTANQRQRVRNLIFSHDFKKIEEKPQFNSYKQNLMRNTTAKMLWLVGGLSFAVIFITLPILWIGLSNMKPSMSPVDLNNEERPLTDDSEKNESVDSTSNFDDRVRISVEDNRNDNIIDQNSYANGLIDGDKKYDDPLFAGNSVDIESGKIVYNGNVLDEVNKPANTVEDTTTPANDRAKLQTADIAITVEDFDKRYGELTSKVVEFGGFIQSSNTSSGIYMTKSGQFTIRIPADKFEEFMIFVRGIALTVDRETTSISDLQSQLTQAKRQIELTQKKIDELKTKTQPTDEEKNELKALETRIEGEKEAEKMIEQETDFSTITVSMANEYQSQSPIQSTWEDAKETLGDILNFWGSALLWIGVSIVFISPIILIGYIIVKIIKKLVARIR